MLYYLVVDIRSKLWPTDCLLRTYFYITCTFLTFPRFYMFIDRLVE